MKTYWADITVKIHADNIDEAEAIVTDSAYQSQDIYPGQIKIMSIEVDNEE